MEETLARVIGDVQAHTLADLALAAADAVRQFVGKAAGQSSQAARQRPAFSVKQSPLWDAFFSCVGHCLGGTALWFDQLVLSSFQHPWLSRLRRIVTFWARTRCAARPAAAPGAGGAGALFVKFGQVLSTRRDLLPPDVAESWPACKTAVPPFDSQIAVDTIEKSFRKPLDRRDFFQLLSAEPVASASIAQVHFATIRGRDGGEREVAVKVVRPGMKRVIDKDLALMHMMAGWVEKLSADGKRLKPREVVAEFDTYLNDELDLVREASNAAQLRRNMAGLDLLLVPEILLGFLPHRRDGDGAHAWRADQPG